MHATFCQAKQVTSESHPLELTAIFPHCRMASPIFIGCCAPGEVLFSVSLLHVLQPTWVTAGGFNSHPATISSLATTPSFACCSLNYFHSCLSLSSYHFLKRPWVLLCLLTTHHLSSFMSCFWEELKDA